MAPGETLPLAVFPLFSLVFFFFIPPYAFSYQVILITTFAAAFIFLSDPYFPSSEKLVVNLTANHKTTVC